MAKQRRTEIIRTHNDFASLVKTIQAKKLAQQRRFVRASRVTLAIANQYKKYPQLFDELQGADLR